MARQVRFGTADLPRSFAPAADSLDRAIPSSKVPRADGARIITGYAGEKVLPVRGGLIRGPIGNLGAYSTVRDALDALKSQLAGGPANLYFHDDRYYRNVQARGVHPTHEPAEFERIIYVEIDFVTGDPFQYSTTLTTDTWTPVTGTRVVASGGNTSAAPIYKLTTGSANINWTITNNTTGRSFTIVGTGLTIGNIIEVDTLEQTVKIGAVDRMDLFDGLFFLLANGNNTLETIQTLGTISNFDTVLRSRWWG